MKPYFESGAGLLASGPWGWLGWGWLGWGWLGWTPPKAGAGAAGLAGWVAGLGWAGPGGWAGGLGWATLKRKLICLKMKRKLVSSKNGKVCLHRKNELPHGQQQQAISIYFFLEGLGFRVDLGFIRGLHHWNRVSGYVVVHV